MPFLNLDFNYFNHPKTRRLVALLGYGTESLPIRLWAYCGQYHAKDGALDEYTDVEIEGLIEWSGEPRKAVECLVKTGFMEITENGYKIHDWDHHQGHIEALKKRNRKVAIARWKNINKKHKKSKFTVDTRAVPVAYQEAISGIPQSFPIQSNPFQSNPDPIEPTKDNTSVFEELWNLYPSKDGKKAALKHFKASVKTDADVDRIKTALSKYLSSSRVKSGYVKNGDTWFYNWQDWVDYVDSPIGGQNGNGKHIAGYATPKPTEPRIFD